MTCNLHARWREGVRRQDEITAKLKRGDYEGDTANDIQDLLEWITDLRKERMAFGMKVLAERGKGIA